MMKNRHLAKAVAGQKHYKSQKYGIEDSFHIKNLLKVVDKSKSI